MKIFISDITSYVGISLRAAFARKTSESDEEVAVVGSSRDVNSQIYLNGSDAVRQALDSNVVIVNLLTSTAEARSIIEALRNDMEAQSLRSASNQEDRGRKMRSIIAVSTALTWDHSTAIQQPFDEAHWRRRRPGTRTAEVKAMEAAVLALARPERGTRAHVIGAGMPYGDGEGALYALVRRAWLCLDKPSDVTTTELGGHGARGATSPAGLPVPALRSPDGGNKVPAIHVRDLAAFVTRVALASASGSLTEETETGLGENDADPDSDMGVGAPQPAQYFLAVDEGRDSLTDIVASIATAVGSGGTRLVGKEEGIALLSGEDAPVLSGAISARSGGTGAAAASAAMVASLEAAKQPSFGWDATLRSSAAAQLAASSTFEMSSAAIFADPRVALDDAAWHSRSGPAAFAAAGLLGAEFKTVHDLRPIRVIVLGPPGSGKTALSLLLGSRYGLPVVSASAAIAAIRRGSLRALSDGTSARNTALGALRDAVERAFTEAEAAVSAALAAAASSTSKGGSSAARVTSTKAKSSIDGDSASSSSPPLSAGDRGVRLSAALVARCIRAVLLSPECRNKGWVLDGSLHSWRDAQALFSVLPDGDDGITPAEDDAAGTIQERQAVGGDSDPLSYGLLSVGAKEEAEDDELLAAEAAALGINVPVPSHIAGALAARTEDERAALVEGAPDLAASNDVEPRLRPTAAIILDADDAWLEARVLAKAATVVAANHDTREGFARRLMRYRLHASPALNRTPIGWLETVARQEVHEINAWDIARSTAQPPTAEMVASQEAALRSGSVSLDLVVATRVAAEQALKAKSHTHAAARDTLSLLLPSDLPTAELQHAARQNVELLKQVAPFLETGGRPSNLRPTPAEAAILQAAVQNRAEALVAAASAAEAVEREAAGKERAAVRAEEEAKAAAAARAETLLLEARTAPLRSYLVSSVVPHVTAGLIEVCKAAPADPVDYLAGYLFRVAARLEDEARARQQSGLKLTPGHAGH